MGPVQTRIRSPELAALRCLQGPGFEAAPGAVLVLGVDWWEEGRLLEGFCLDFD